MLEVSIRWLEDRAAAGAVQATSDPLLPADAGFRAGELGVQPAGDRRLRGDERVTGSQGDGAPPQPRPTSVVYTTVRSTRAPCACG